MKNIMEKFAALFIVAALFVSCSDETTDLLDEGNYVGVNSELYSGLWGCASTVADVADQALILEALRGNRLMLRGIGLNEKELEILGISHAGE